MLHIFRTSEIKKSAGLAHFSSPLEVRGQFWVLESICRSQYDELRFVGSGLQVFSLSLQMVGKMGGDSMSHMNTSSAGVEPTLYYPGQKRPGEDGGENVLCFSLVEMLNEHT